MSLVIFDLDNTLIRGDSDHSWGEFLIEKGRVDPVEFSRKNDQFYQDYQDGTLDIFAYQRFALAPVIGMTKADVAPLHEEFMEAKISQMWLPKAEALVRSHREKGDDLLIITATNRLITLPIAEKFGIDALIATEPETIDGKYTGEVDGTPSFQKGKITRLEEWLKSYEGTMKNSCFYSDSHNDLPLLECVDRPVAVDPDEKLREIALEKDWEIISLR